MNFTAPNGKILHTFTTLCDDKKTFPGNVYQSSDARITHAWMEKEMAELKEDEDTVNFVSRFHGTDYVVMCDAGFVDKHKGKQLIHRKVNYLKRQSVTFTLDPISTTAVATRCDVVFRFCVLLASECCLWCGGPGMGEAS